MTWDAYDIGSLGRHAYDDKNMWGPFKEQDTEFCGEVGFTAD